MQRAPGATKGAPPLASAMEAQFRVKGKKDLHAAGQDKPAAVQTATKELFNFEDDFPALTKSQPKNVAIIAAGAGVKTPQVSAKNSEEASLSKKKERKISLFQLGGPLFTNKKTPAASIQVLMGEQSQTSQPLSISATAPLQPLPQTLTVTTTTTATTSTPSSRRHSSISTPPEEEAAEASEAPSSPISRLSSRSKQTALEEASDSDGEETSSSPTNLSRKNSSRISDSEEENSQETDAEELPSPRSVSRKSSSSEAEEAQETDVEDPSSPRSVSRKSSTFEAEASEQEEDSLSSPVNLSRQSSKEEATEEEEAVEATVSEKEEVLPSSPSSLSRQGSKAALAIEVEDALLAGSDKEKTLSSARSNASPRHFSLDSEERIAEVSAKPSSPRVESKPSSPRAASPRHVEIQIPASEVENISACAQEAVDGPVFGPEPASQAKIVAKEVQEVFMEAVKDLKVDPSQEPAIASVGSPRVHSPASRRPSVDASASNEVVATVHAAATEVLEQTPPPAASLSQTAATDLSAEQAASAVAPSQEQELRASSSSSVASSSITQAPAELQETLASADADCKEVARVGEEANTKQLQYFQKLHTRVLKCNDELTQLNSELGNFQSKVAGTVNAVFASGYQWQEKNTETCKGYLATYKGLKERIDALHAQATADIQELAALNIKFSKAIEKDSYSLTELSKKIAFTIAQYMTVQEAWGKHVVTWNNQSRDLQSGADQLKTHETTLEDLLGKLKAHKGAAGKLEEETAAKKAEATTQRGWFGGFWSASTTEPEKVEKAEKKAETKEEDLEEELCEDLKAIDLAQKAFWKTAAQGVDKQLAEFNTLHSRFVEGARALRALTRESGADLAELSLDVNTLVNAKVDATDEDRAMFDRYTKSYEALRDRIRPLKKELETTAGTLDGHAKNFSGEIRADSGSLSMQELAIKVGFSSKDYLDAQKTWKEKRAEWVRESSHFASGARQIGTHDLEMERLLGVLKGRVTPQKGLVEWFLGSPETAKPSDKQAKSAPKVEATAGAAT